MAKTFKEALSEGYNIFSRFGSERRMKLIEATAYIENLSQSTNIRIDDWDIIEVFGTGEGNEIVTQHEEINRRFFAKFKKIQEETPLELRAIEAEILAEIDAHTKSLVEKQIKSYEKNAQSNENSAQNYFSEAQNYLARANENRKMARALTATADTRLRGEISKVLKGMAWDFLGWKKPLIYFVTRNDIIVEKKNPAANLDLKVNFGKLIARFNVDSQVMSCAPYENNFLYGEYSTALHCFVHYEGNICWGNAKDQALKLMRDYKLAETMELLHLLLTNVAEGVTPYTALEYFAEVAKARGLPKNKAKPLDFSRPPTQEPQPQPSDTVQVVEHPNPWGPGTIYQYASPLRVQTIASGAALREEYDQREAAIREAQERVIRSQQQAMQSQIMQGLDASLSQEMITNAAQALQRVAQDNPREEIEF